MRERERGEEDEDGYCTWLFMLDAWSPVFSFCDLFSALRFSFSKTVSGVPSDVCYISSRRQREKP